MSKQDMIDIAKELPYITPEDIKWFEEPTTTEADIQHRMIQRRKDW